MNERNAHTYTYTYAWSNTVCVRAQHSLFVHFSLNLNNEITLYVEFVLDD